MALKSYWMYQKISEELYFYGPHTHNYIQVQYTPFGARIKFWNDDKDFSSNVLLQKFL